MIQNQPALDKFALVLTGPTSDRLVPDPVDLFLVLFQTMIQKNSRCSDRVLVDVILLECCGLSLL